GLSLRLILAKGQPWERSAVFRRATSDPAAMMIALQGKLTGLDIAAPVERVSVVLNGLTGETGYQDSHLISQRVGDLKNLRDALAQLKARTGRSPIAKVV